MRVSSLFVALPILVRIVSASGIPFYPSQFFPYVLNPEQAVLTLMKNLDKCVCTWHRAIDVHLKKIMRDEAGINDVQNWKQKIHEHPSYDDVMNRWLRRCALEFQQQVEWAKASRQPILNPPRTQRLPPSLPKVSDAKLKKINQDMINCVCEPPRGEKTFKQLDSFSVGEMAGYFKKLRDCLARFLRALPKDALTVPASKPVVAPPATLEVNNIRRFVRKASSQPPEQAQVGLMEFNGGAVLQKAGKDLQATAWKIQDGISDKLNMQPIKSWMSCMGDCMQQATPANFLGFLGSCMEGARCPDPGETLGRPKLETTKIMPAAEKLLVDNEQQFPRMVERFGMKPAVQLFLGTLVRYPVAAALSAL